MSKIFTILTLLWLLSIGGTTNATDWYQMHQETNYLLTMTVYRRVITMHFCGCELMNWVATNCDIKFISVDIIEPWKH